MLPDPASDGSMPWPYDQDERTRVLTRSLLQPIQSRGTVGSVDIQIDGGHVWSAQSLHGEQRGEREEEENENARWVWLIYAVRGRHLVLSERMGDSRV